MSRSPLSCATRVELGLPSPQFPVAPGRGSVAVQVVPVAGSFSNQHVSAEACAEAAGVVARYLERMGGGRPCCSQP